MSAAGQEIVTFPLLNTIIPAGVGVLLMFCRNANDGKADGVNGLVVPTGLGKLLN